MERESIHKAPLRTVKRRSRVTARRETLRRDRGEAAAIELAIQRSLSEAATQALGALRRLLLAPQSGSSFAGSTRRRAGVQMKCQGDEIGGKKSLRCYVTLIIWNRGLRRRRVAHLRGGTPL